MRYPWIFTSILSIWIAIAVIMYQAADRSDPNLLYVVGVIFTTLIALKGFKSEY